MNAFLQLKRSMTRHMVEADIFPVTPVQVEILMRIGQGEQKSAALASDMQASPSAIAQHIAALVELGYVNKTSSPTDRRHAELSLTTTGKHVIRAKQALMRQRVEHLVEYLTDEELDQFIATCQKIANSNQ